MRHPLVEGIRRMCILLAVLMALPTAALARPKAKVKPKARPAIDAFVESAGRFAKGAESGTAWTNDAQAVDRSCSLQAWAAARARNGAAHDAGMVCVGALLHRTAGGKTWEGLAPAANDLFDTTVGLRTDMSAFLASALRTPGGRNLTAVKKLIALVRPERDRLDGEVAALRSAVDEAARAKGAPDDVRLAAIRMHVIAGDCAALAPWKADPKVGGIAKMADRMCRLGIEPPCGDTVDPEGDGALPLGPALVREVGALCQARASVRCILEGKAPVRVKGVEPASASPGTTPAFEAARLLRRSPPGLDVAWLGKAARAFPDPAPGTDPDAWLDVLAAAASLGTPEEEDLDRIERLDEAQAALVAKSDFGASFSRIGGLLASMTAESALGQGMGILRMLVDIDAAVWQSALQSVLKEILGAVATWAGCPAPGPLNLDGAACRLAADLPEMVAREVVTSVIEFGRDPAPETLLREAARVWGAVRDASAPILAGDKLPARILAFDEALWKTDAFRSLAPLVDRALDAEGKVRTARVVFALFQWLRDEGGKTLPALKTKVPVELVQGLLAGAAGLDDPLRGARAKALAALETAVRERSPTEAATAAVVAGLVFRSGTTDPDPAGLAEGTRHAYDRLVAEAWPGTRHVLAARACAVAVAVGTPATVDAIGDACRRHDPLSVGAAVVGSLRDERNDPGAGPARLMALYRLLEPLLQDRDVVQGVQTLLRRYVAVAGARGMTNEVEETKKFLTVLTNALGGSPDPADGAGQGGDFMADLLASLDPPVAQATRRTRVFRGVDAVFSGQGFDPMSMLTRLARTAATSMDLKIEGSLTGGSGLAIVVDIPGAWDLLPVNEGWLSEP